MEIAFGIFTFFFMILLIILPVAFIFGSLVLWIIALIDVTKRDFKHDNDKTTWLLIVLLLGGIGAVVYYFTVMRNPAKYTK